MAKRKRSSSSGAKGQTTMKRFMTAKKTKPPRGRTDSGETIHKFTRTLYLSSDFIAVPGAFNGVGRSFSLSALPNYTEYTALFDAYRITKVKVDYVPRYDAATQSATGAANVQGHLHGVIDYDDNNNPTSVDQMCQYGTYRRSRCSEGMSFTLTPKIGVNVYTTPVVNGMLQMGKQWLDCVNPSVPHYGIKIANEGNCTASTAYDVFVKYWIEFKNTI